MNEITLIIHAWLLHETHGVEAMLATIPRLNMDGSENPEPDMPDIFNDVETEEMALELDPPAEKSVIVWTDGAITMKQKASRRYVVAQSPVDVFVAYCTQDENASIAKRDGGYILRAAMKSLHRFNNGRYCPREARTLNGLTIANLGDIRIANVAGAAGNSKLWGLVVAKALVTDSIVV